MNLIRLKTKDLTLDQLDWAVAKAKGLQPMRRHDFIRDRHEWLRENGYISKTVNLEFHLKHQTNDQVIGDITTGRSYYLPYYSASSTHVGDMIQVYQITVGPRTLLGIPTGEYAAYKDWKDGEPKFTGIGKNPAEATCQCLVYALLGDWVEVPEKVR